MKTFIAYLLVIIGIPVFGGLLAAQEFFCKLVEHLN